MVGLEEKVQISESQINLENDSSEECSNDEQDRYMASDHKTTSIDMVLDEKTTSIDMVIGDMILEAETTQIDMIISDKADIEKSQSAKLFKLKAEIGEIIMPGGHSNCSIHSAANDKKYFAKSKVFGGDSLFGLEQNQFQNFVITRSWFGIKHRWPPPLYCSATFVLLC